MDKVKMYADEICEELEGAKSYAECYVDSKIMNNSTSATRYKEMATDELKHASYLHDMLIQYMDDTKKAIQVPKEMQDTWKECNGDFVYKTAVVKQMLTL